MEDLDKALDICETILNELPELSMYDFFDNNLELRDNFTKR